jgi:hypothetical protein
MNKLKENSRISRTQQKKSFFHDHWIELKIVSKDGNRITSEEIIFSH